MNLVYNCENWLALPRFFADFFSAFSLCLLLASVTFQLDDEWTKIQIQYLYTLETSIVDAQ